MHNFHASILREYDIRGIFGDTLTGEDALWVGKSLGTLIVRDGGTDVVVGYDGRLSSPDLESSMAEGLKSTGLKVFRIGLGPTPMTSFAVHSLNADGGVMITGSHNPPEYNGFKLMLGTDSLHGEAIRALGQMASSGDIVENDSAGQLVEHSIFETFVDRLLQEVSEKNLSVGWDPANGASGDLVKAVTTRLPGRHLLINEEIDGTFPAHHPDPTVEANLEQLKELVLSEKLDFGVGFDGDGDRIGAVDENGRVVWGDELLAILAEDVLGNFPGAPIIADVKAGQGMFDRIEELGGRAIMWKTGHSLIKAKMKEEKAPLAGEMSGHIFFADRYYGYDDALYAALRLMNVVAASGKTLGQLKDQLPAFVSTPEIRFDCADERKFQVIEEVTERLTSSGADMSTLDGVRVKTEGGWWLLRASNTQPSLVARCEGPDEATLLRIKAQLVAILKSSEIEPPPEL